MAWGRKLRPAAKGASWDAQGDRCGETGHDVSPDRLGGNKLGPSVRLLDILRRARFPEQREQLFRERRERNTNTAANNLHTHTPLI